MLVVHGMAEHSGRYERLAAFFQQRGFTLYALDHIGHGRSEGERGFIESFEDYLLPIEQLLEIIRQRHADVPVFIIGHSMGGLISAAFLLRHQALLTGCVLSGAALDVGNGVSRAEQWLLRLVARCYPHCGVLKLNAVDICRDPLVVEDYINDPLVYKGRVCASLAHHLLTECDQLMQSAGSIGLPLLIMHGEDDQLTSVEGSKTFYKKVSSKDKKIIIYPGLFHEIFNESCHQQVFHDVLVWLEARL